MGILKIWKVSGLTKEGAVLSEPIHRLGQYVTNQKNEEISASMKADLIASGKQYTYMYDFLNSYINGLKKHHDEATKFLVMFAAYGCGSDGYPWDWNQIRNLSQGLWGSMEDTPDKFKLQNIPLIKKSINQINDFIMTLL